MRELGATGPLRLYCAERFKPMLCTGNPANWGGQAVVGRVSGGCRVSLNLLGFLTACEPGITLV